MNAQELLCYLTEKQVDQLFELANSFPADKLDWKPTPSSRSALDQLQEIATALDVFFLNVIDHRKIEWSPDRMAAWQADRKRFATVEELEKECRTQTGRLLDFIRTTTDANLDEPVEMPFPGKFNLADILAYHYWNISYHIGQVTYIQTMLADGG